MENIKVFDHLNMGKDKDILKIINEEKIYYSECIVKINQAGKNQERNFVLTNKYVYNFKKKNLKRKIPITSILGLSYSTISNEFIIHGKHEQYDYSYISKNKIIILCLIVLLYQELDDKIMHICEINEKSLTKYVTYEKDKKRNKEITKMNLKFQISTKLFIDKNIQFIQKDKNETNKKKKQKNLRMLSYSDFKDFIIMESKIKIEHFKLIKEIKRDVFGKLVIAKYLKDNKLYKLKSINKEFLLNNNLTEKKSLEKYIFQTLDYPFINKMVFCFQREDKIFFGFNYIKTINFYQQLCLNRFFPEDIVKFYASIIGLTLEFLHKNRFIYRNFNLEFLSITEDGFLLFNNFNNVKLIDEIENTDIKYCGPIEYFAPEVILGEKHSEVSDWWCFGIIIYEMFFGVPPFLNEKNDKLYNMILNEEIKFPKKNNISVEAKDLLQKLLIKEKNDRLGYDGGFGAIKNHYFFKGIDFDSLEKKKIDPPFKPLIEDEINSENNENFNFFNNIDFNIDNISESHLDYISKNQDKFNEFYE